MTSRSGASTSSTVEGAPVALALALAVTSWAGPARATLLDDVGVLTSGWDAASVRVERDRPRFVQQGEVRHLEPVESRPGACRVLVAIAARQVQFTLQPMVGGTPANTIASRAGVVEIEDCGLGLLDEAPALRMASPRGTIEVFRLWHEGNYPAVSSLLPARASGPAGGEREPPQPFELAPAADRRLRALRTARLDGAEAMVTVSARADAEGEQAIAVRMREGCHRLVVIADQDTTAQLVDVDAEVLSSDGTRVLARDRSHAPDARLDFCIGDEEAVQLRWVGAGSGAAVSILDARWPLPDEVPTHWGSVVRAGLSWALHRHHAPAPSEPPVTTLVGIPGATLIPVEIDPRRCYVAAFATAAGEASVGRIAVRVGARLRHDDAMGEVKAAAVSFCARGERTARLQVDLRGRGGFWVMSLWPVGAP